MAGREDQPGGIVAQNLIDLLDRLLGSGDVLSRLGAVIGASPAKTKSAIGTAVPALLAGLVGVAQSPEGRNRLATQVQGQDTGLLDNITDALSGGRGTSLIDSGNSTLSSLLGQDKIDGLAGAVSRFAGLDRTSTQPLLGALAPIVMSVLGREQRSQGLDAQGLASMLGEQKDNIAQALPAGLASALGPTGLLDGVADRPGRGASTVEQADRATAAGADRAAGAVSSQAAGMAAGARRSGSTLRWAVGGVAALAVLWIAYQSLFRGEQVEQATEQVVDTAAQVGESAKSLMVGDVDVGREVSNLFESATTALNDVTDNASADAARPKLSEVSASLDKVGGLVEQLPAEGKSALAALVTAALPDLETLVAKVNEIPGAADAIKPVADAMLEKMRAMTA